MSTGSPPASPGPLLPPALPRLPLNPDKARLSYLAKVRHDLRTPVNHIIGYCEMLQEESDDPSWVNFLGDLEKILEGGKQLLGLVTYYFDSTRINLQKLDPHLIQHELRTPLNHIIGYSELLQEQAKELGKKTVVSDLGKIRSAAHLLLDLVEAHLFHPRVAMEIWQDSGSIWPILEHTPEPLPSLKLEGGVILVVDDHPLNREMLDRRLRRQGFTVIQASGGAEALELARASHPDLVLLDMVMPGMDGFEVLKRIKGDRTLRSLSVIMLSASDEAATAVHCIKMGADDFLPKPCNTTLLMARMESALAKRRLREMSKLEPGFYCDKGTLQSDSPSYVERQADRDLFDGLRGGELCYVLTSRQMGKSSLMVRTAGRLREFGSNVVVIDLTALGFNVTLDQWYDGMLTRFGRQLRLEDELEECWLRSARLSPVQRFFSALREVAMGQHNRPLVVFVDELDIVRSLPFSTDEFFAAIRECYNRRAVDGEFDRLSFCLLGVATPGDLVRDAHITPFNIGRRIELADFTRDEAAPLEHGLGRDERLSREMFDRVFYWTNGHPYLTQRFCRAIALDSSIADTGGIDLLAERLFLSAKAREEADNLVFVRKWMESGESHQKDLLDLYGQALNGPRKLRDEDPAALLNVLRLAGIVRFSESSIEVRNRIYSQVFDAHWVQANR